MVGKIAGINVYAQASKSADKIMKLGKTDEVIYMGEERDGLYRVTTPQGEGWVEKLLIKKL
ncbi:SH3 domain-containing protein [Rugamonas sp. CCM 8940]|uniref:SH3 domain-containing protein n=1 Tax=Rugamonas sp. CCM 8940 TaxID=2765359 RepID=UPI0018F2A665|nr:SH3 domain-containing protein [Rugamonas sp. CCM 8940]MBJ7312028.1 SH3 domain-containing protein [Rugamonas sp. CCM 8940]